MNFPTREGPATGGGSEGPPRPTRRSRAARIVVGALLTLLGVLAVGLLLLQHPGIATTFVNAVAARVAPLPRSALHVQEVRGNWLTRIELRGLRLSRGDTLLFSIDTLAVRYRLPSLLLGLVRITDLRLAGPRLTADIGDTNRAPRATPRRPPLTPADLLRGRFYRGPALAVDRLTLSDGWYGGRFGAADSGLQITDVSLVARRLRLGTGFSFVLDSLAMGADRLGVPRPPVDVRAQAALERGRLEASARGVRGTALHFDAAVTAQQTGDGPLADVRLLFHAPPFRLRDLDLQVAGLDPDASIELNVDLRGTRADRMSGNARLGMGRGRFGGVALGPTELDVVMTDGRADTRLSTASDRSPIEVRGWLRPFDKLPTYELQAEARRLVLNATGVPRDMAARAAADVNLAVKGEGFVRPRLDVRGGAHGEAGRVDLDGGLDLTSGFGWTVRRLAFESLDLAHLTGDTLASLWSGTLTGNGQRMESRRERRLTARLDLAPSHLGDRTLTARIRGQVAGERLGGAIHVATDVGRLAVDSLDGRWDNVGTLRLIRARVDSLDPGRLAGRPEWRGTLSGSLRGGLRGFMSLRAPPGARAALRTGKVTADLALILEPTKVQGESLSAGSLRLDLARGLVKLKANAVTTAGHIDGAAAARPFDEPVALESLRLEFADLNLAPWLGNTALRSKLNGKVTGSARAGRTRTAGPRWTLESRMERSDIGDASLEWGELHGQGSNRDAHVTGRFPFGTDTLELRGDIGFDGGSAQGRASLAIPLRAIVAYAGRDSLPAEGAIAADVSFERGRSGDLDLTGTLTGRGSVDRARLDSLRADLRLRRGWLQVDTVNVRSNVGIVSGRGGIALTEQSAVDTSDLRVALTVTDASPLAVLLGVDSVSVIKAGAEARIAGPRDALRFDVKGEVRSLVCGDVRLLDGELDAHGTLDRDRRLHQATATAKLRRLRGILFPVSEGTARATYEQDRLAFDLGASESSRQMLRLVGHLERDSTARQLTIETFDSQLDSTAWSLEKPSRIEIHPTRLRVDSFDLRSKEGRVLADGVLDRRGEQSFNVEVRRARVDVLARVLGREGLKGWLEGGLKLTGPAASPVASGDMRLEWVADERPAGVVRTRASWRDGRLDVNGGFATQDGDSLVFTGFVPLALSLALQDYGVPAPLVRAREGDMDVQLRAQRFPLQEFTPFLNPRTIGPLQGTLDVDARLRGPGKRLAGSGSIDLSGGVLPLKGLGVTYQDMTLHANLDGDRLVLREARASTGKGRIEATGHLRFAQATRIEPKVHLVAQRFALSRAPDLRATASANLDVTGTLNQLIVRGSVTPENCDVYIKPSDLSSGGEQVQLSGADVRMLEESFEFDAPRGGDRGALYDASDLDLSVTLDHNNWVRQRSSPRAALPLTGTFRFVKPPYAEPRLTGRIEIVPNRGYVEQFARSFDLVAGEVLLNGDMKKHTVNVHAQYKPPSTSESDESSVTVRMDVKGTVDDLKLVLSSDPAMSEQEIISFIATGRSATDPTTPTGASEASLARDIGLSQLSNVAGDAAKGAVGLDVLQVRFDALQGATLVAGRYIDPRLYVGFRQPLQYKETATNTSNTTVTSVELEYSFYRWLVWNLQGESSKVRSFFRVRHAY